jgi:hypothetical protein
MQELKTLIPMIHCASHELNVSLQDNDGVNKTDNLPAFSSQICGCTVVKKPVLDRDGAAALRQA